MSKKQTPKPDKPADEVTISGVDALDARVTQLERRIEALEAAARGDAPYRVPVDAENT